jgi:hypothetical protein
MNRREFLKNTLIAGAAAWLPTPLLAVAGKSLSSSLPSRQTAKAMIQIWMWGGPAHLDTFDPKPEAGPDYCGEWNQPIATNVPGIRIHQMLPLLAKQADKYAIIRSMTHGVNAHETASYLMQTGHMPGRLVYPNVGAVISKLRGYDQNYQGVIPPYVVLTQSQGRFDEAGLLGSKYKPFCTGGDPNQQRFEVEGIVSQGVSDARQHERRRVLKELDLFGACMGPNPALRTFDEAENEAYEFMFGEAREIFNLGNESEEVRKKYGRNTFGQSCLMARRLVEKGVPYVTINYRGWDTHKRHFGLMNRMLPELDAGFSALLQDLRERNLLDSTIVWWGGEFGRSPRIQWEAPWNGGRSHYGQCFSVVVAGGGFKGGQVVGASDAKGAEVKDRPVSPRDLVASFYHLFGINPNDRLDNPKGLEVTVLPDEKEDKIGRGMLKEIMS